MTLYDICMEIADIEKQLDYGQIPFSYDNLASAMKAGHPVEILDEILSTIFYDVMAGKTPELDKVKEMLTDLEGFQTAFKVDLDKQIKELENYIKSYK